MAWFTSHQEFKDDPRTLDLMAEMNWDLDVCIGKWTRLIWWCIDYAEDGILGKHKVTRIAQAIGLQPDEGEKLKRALITSGYATDVPDFRIVGWWELMGRFLNVKYKKNQKMLRQIKSLYIDQSNDQLEEGAITVPAEVPVTPNNTVHDTNQQKKIQNNSILEYTTPLSDQQSNDKRYKHSVQIDLILSNIEVPIAEDTFFQWFSGALKIIESENAGRPNNRFSWCPDREQMVKELRTLVYRVSKEEKVEILSKVFNLTGKNISWLEYLTIVIKITVRQSAVEPLRNAIGFALSLRKEPEKVISNPSTGVFL